MDPIIISGGPGAGKTTLLHALAERGFTTFNEVPRDLIEQQSQLENGILPWDNLPAFAELCLQGMQQQKQQAMSEKVAFLDRAIPDICAYLSGAGYPLPQRYLEGSRGYHSQVFFCQPNEFTYVQDEVRPYPFSEALELHQQLLASYQSLGYHIIEVPWASVSERAEFVARHIMLGK